MLIQYEITAILLTIKLMNKRLTLTATLVACLLSSSAFAGENRYQAHWNGKSYLIIDSDDGHLWTLRNDSMIYKGQVDGDQFIPPKSPQVWQQLHGKWSKNN